MYMATTVLLVLTYMAPTVLLVLTYMAPTVLLVLTYMAPTVLLVLTYTAATASILLFLTYTAATASHRPMVRVAANHSQLSENILYVLHDSCTQQMSMKGNNKQIL